MWHTAASRQQHEGNVHISLGTSIHKVVHGEEVKRWGRGWRGGGLGVEEVPYLRSSICFGQIPNETFFQSAGQYNCVLNLLL